MQNAKQFLAGCLVLLFICGAIYVFTDCGGPATTVANPTDMALPGASAEPRDPTAFPAVPLDVQLYIATAQPISSDLRDALQAFVSLLDRADYGTPDWVIDMAVQIAIARQLHQTALAIIDVPADMAAVHLALVGATGSFSAAMDSWTRAYDNDDAAALAESERLMNQGREHAERATALLTAYAREHGRQ